LRHSLSLRLAITPPGSCLQWVRSLRKQQKRQIRVRMPLKSLFWVCVRIWAARLVRPLRCLLLPSHTTSGSYHQGGTGAGAAAEKHACVDDAPEPRLGACVHQGWLGVCVGRPLPLFVRFCHHVLQAHPLARFDIPLQTLGDTTGRRRRGRCRKYAAAVDGPALYLGVLAHQGCAGAGSVMRVPIPSSMLTLPVGAGTVVGTGAAGRAAEACAADELNHIRSCVACLGVEWRG
jgi:hypothetical protein